MSIFHFSSPKFFKKAGVLEDAANAVFGKSTWLHNFFGQSA
jgi:hypothetical protein